MAAAVGVLLMAAGTVLTVGCRTNTAAPDPPRCLDDCSRNVVQALGDAYRARDQALLASMLAPDFTFYRDEADPDNGELSWDRATELRIHARMFDPEHIPASDMPLVEELWLQQATITLSQQNPFTERLDLYTTADPPGPLDPALWKVEEATYGTDLFLQLRGADDYAIHGRAYVVVITDLNKAITDPSRFLLYRIEDLGPELVTGNTTQEVLAATWTRFKEMYR